MPEANAGAKRGTFKKGPPSYRIDLRDAQDINANFPAQVGRVRLCQQRKVAYKCVAFCSDPKVAAVWAQLWKDVGLVVALSANSKEVTGEVDATKLAKLELPDANEKIRVVVPS